MISKFEGRYKFLSNFYYDEIHYDGKRYPTVEHAYQAAKTNDETEKKRIANAKTPAEAKKLGKKVTMRSDWETVKFDVMRQLISKKFGPRTELSVSLIQTDPEELVEGNWWGDRIWGQSPVGVGENHLGKILMEQRAYLIKEVGKVGGNRN